MLLGAVHLVAAALGLRTRAGLDRETLVELSDGWPAPGVEHPMAYLEVGPAAADHGWVPADMAGVLRARHSGPALFDPEPTAAPRAMLDELCTVLAHAPFADFACHLYLSRVSGVAPGRYLLTGDGLRLVEPGDVVPALEQIGRTEGRVSMNFRTVAFTAYLAVRRGAAVARYGEDAFRRLHLVAGAAAHLLSVVAARHGQSARVHNGYDAGTAGRLLGLDGTDETVLFQIAVGRAKPAPGFRLPVVF